MGQEKEAILLFCKKSARESCSVLTVLLPGPKRALLKTKRHKDVKAENTQ